MFTCKLSSLWVATFMVALAWAATLNLTAEMAAGKARCAERGIRMSGVEWQWVGGGMCQMPSSPRNKKKGKNA